MVEEKEMIHAMRHNDEAAALAEQLEHVHKLLDDASSRGSKGKGKHGAKRKRHKLHRVAKNVVNANKATHQKKHGAHTKKKKKDDGGGERTSARKKKGKRGSKFGGRKGSRRDSERRRISQQRLLSLMEVARLRE